MILIYKNKKSGRLPLSEISNRWAKWSLTEGLHCSTNVGFNSKSVNMSFERSALLWLVQARAMTKTELGNKIASSIKGINASIKSHVSARNEYENKNISLKWDRLEKDVYLEVYNDLYNS